MQSLGGSSTHILYLKKREREREGGGGGVEREGEDK